MRNAPLFLESDIKTIVERLGQDAQQFAGQTVLVSGGHGFLGRHFLIVLAYLNEHLLKRRCRVIVVDNHITSAAPLLKRAWRDGYRFIQHDLARPLTIRGSVDYIIHAAGIASPYYYRKYPLETLEVATLGTRHLLEIARQRPVKGFLFFSSSEIYGNPDEKHIPTTESYAGNVSCLGPRACYDESKRLGETLCAVFHEEFGVPATMVRPFNVYGPGMSEADYRVIPNFTSRIIGRRPLHIYGTGKQTRTFCYITDAIVGFFKALLRGARGQAYNIGNPSPEVSMLELAKVFQRVVRRKLPLEVIEYPDAYPSDEPQRRCPDLSKAARHLDYHPVVGLSEGLHRVMKWAEGVYTGSPF
ncbi:MAG: NAD-dependent epimerase/dehydratase family protein [Candidatus Omnitrophica bacterium]|nr:NAD-dependent epimerase/dehydratase family protein [Candidatus Omnitrophota bacterium]